MVDKKLIEDLETLAAFEGFFISGVANRALEKIQNLEDQVESYKSNLRWIDFQTGEMK